MTRCCNEKLLQISNSCPYSNQSSHLFKSGLLKRNPKSWQIFGLLIKEKLLPKTFEKHPIWSHCLRVSRCLFESVVRCLCKVIVQWLCVCFCVVLASECVCMCLYMHAYMGVCVWVCMCVWSQKGGRDYWRWTLPLWTQKRNKNRKWTSTHYRHHHYYDFHYLSWSSKCLLCSNCKMNDGFSKMGQHRPLFWLIFDLFNKKLQFLQWCEKGSSSTRHLDSNSRPFGSNYPPLNTKPGLHP